MAQLAIKGHATRGKEVIALLEMLGGNNKYHINITECNLLYTMREGDDVIIATYPNSSISQIYTLEQFLEKFPYKVGNKVNYIKYNDGYPSVYTIQGMRWTGVTIEYLLDSNGFSALTKDLQPYKEKTMTEITIDIPKGYEFAGIDDNRQQVVFTKIQPEYPKTYEECHNLMVQWKEYDCNPNSELILCEAPIHDFCKLIVARNIYWKIAGEQMGLGKPWEPDWKDNSDKYFICYLKDELWMSNIRDCNRLLVFPTKEMRDEFYDNFEKLIECCKKLL